MPKYIPIDSLKEDEVAARVQKKIQEKKINNTVEKATHDNGKDYLKMLKSTHRHKPNVAQDMKDHITKMKCELEEQKLIIQAQKEHVSSVALSKEGNIISQQVNNILTLPCRDEVKKQLIKRRLDNNEVVQEYISNTLAYNAIAKINKNLRFVAHVGMEYIRAEEDYKLLKYQLQYQQQQQQQIVQQVVVPEETKEIVKEDEVINEITVSESTNE
jgi:hypothetical protein